MRSLLVLLAAASLTVVNSFPDDHILRKREDDEGFLAGALPSLLEKRDEDIVSPLVKRGDLIGDIFKTASCLPLVGGLAQGILSGVGLMDRDDKCRSDRERVVERPIYIDRPATDNYYPNRGMELMALVDRVKREMGPMSIADFAEEIERKKRDVENSNLIVKRGNIIGDIFKTASCLPLIGGLAQGILSGVGLMDKDDRCRSDRERIVERPIYIDRPVEEPTDYIRVSRDIADFVTMAKREFAPLSIREVAEGVASARAYAARK